ncbi:hypothetical protein [Sphingomonas japonica]|uniref:N-acetyltransferase domain-containing protein n=1 Tax=Sphingomonas japonica TaxID=511662 RepID=A0ABX0U459_9SPHN|nr:hypothetical protein [Sphingomonas japonica]NIJ24835.1 hypothetical protein [Sphingomonas japonica]
MTPGDSYLKHRQAFAELLDPRFYSIEWLDSEVWSGAIRTFGNERGCILTRLKQYPTGALEIHGEAAAGDMAAILELIEQAEEWGRQMGCGTATIASRPGWARVLSEKGWALHQTELRKGLL